MITWLEVNEGDEDGEVDKRVTVTVFKNVVNGAFNWLMIHVGSKLKFAIKKSSSTLFISQ